MMNKMKLWQNKLIHLSGRIYKLHTSRAPLLEATFISGFLSPR